jgi:hypothetical protein
MGRKQDPVAFAKRVVIALTLNAQSRSTCDHKHPLVGLLVVPLAFGSRLSGRHDSLDAQAPDR